jgi:hypothetical protein
LRNFTLPPSQVGTFGNNLFPSPTDALTWLKQEGSIPKPSSLIPERPKSGAVGLGVERVSSDQSGAKGFMDFVLEGATSPAPMGNFFDVTFLLIFNIFIFGIFFLKWKKYRMQENQIQVVEEELLNQIV